MITFEVDLAGLLVVFFHICYRLPQHWLGYFGVDYQKIYHVHHFKYQFFMLVDVADGLESKETLFFSTFLRFLDELYADAGPLPAHEVTVIHHVVSVLYVELDVCDVFYNDHVLGCMELHMTLIFEFLIILLHTSDFLFPHPLVIFRLNLFELIF